MFKPRDLKEEDLPLTHLGQEEGTYQNVYKLTSPIGSNAHLSLKYNGYIRRKAILQSGEVIDNAWVK